jgi:inorganic pyrophosphatase
VLVAEVKFGQFFTTIAFLIGGFTSIVAGYIGMRIATFTNVRTTYLCAEDIHKGFVVAYRGGQVLGFCLVGLALLILQILIIVYKAIYLPDKKYIEPTQCDPTKPCPDEPEDNNPIK